MWRPTSDPAAAAELRQGDDAPYKYPRSVKFLEELPKTQTGKVQRSRLRSGA
jgi:acyl-coenzyme A synthetase/AMP-(fatty) acid ligase